MTLTCPKYLHNITTYFLCRFIPFHARGKSVFTVMFYLALKIRAVSSVSWLCLLSNSYCNLRCYSTSIRTCLHKFVQYMYKPFTVPPSSSRLKHTVHFHLLLTDVDACVCPPVLMPPLSFPHSPFISSCFLSPSPKLCLLASSPASLFALSMTITLFL